MAIHSYNIDAEVEHLMVILHHRLVQDGGQGGHLGRGNHNEVYQVESHLNGDHLDRSFLDE